MIRTILGMFLTPLRGRNLRRFWLVRKALSFSIPRKTRVNGYTMYLDREDFTVSKLIARAQYESFETELAQALLRPGDVVLDIGANIGYYTLLFAQKAKRVHAFEPAPDTFALLEKNVRSYPNVETHRVAVGDRSGAVQLFANQYNHGDNRIFASFGKKQGVPVEMQTIDESIGSNEHIDLIKMDIQGAEVLALRGMRNVLANNPSLVLLVEFWPKGIRKSGASVDEMFSILSQQGFDVFVLRENERRLLRMTASEIERVFKENHSLNHMDLLCLRARELPEYL